MDEASALALGEKKEQERESTRRTKKLVQSIPFVYEVYSLFRKYSFQLKAKDLKDTIYHEPNFILKPFAGPSIAMIHDLSHIYFPQFHTLRNVRFLNRHLGETVSRASHIITGSEFNRKEIIQVLGVSENRITTVPHGVDNSYKLRETAELNTVLSRYRLVPGGYLLSVATLEPRKNITRLLEAYMRLDSKVRKEYPLVLVGGQGWRNRDLMLRIRELNKNGEIIHLGYVQERDIPFLYSGARAFVYIPFYEGFGLPVLEAMASGVPFLASNIPSIKEVTGPGKLLVDPEDTDAIQRGLKSILLDDDLRANSLVDGVSRARLFSWEACVDRTVEIYKKLA